MQPDSVRGTPLARFTGVTATDECACTHPFGNHFQQKDQYGFGKTAVNFTCSYCTCQDFVPKEEVERMAIPVSKQAEQNGYELAQRYAKIFVVREDAEYPDKVALGMFFANAQGLTLESGSSFVKGFIDGLDVTSKSRARHMSLEDKVDLLLERELEKKLNPPEEK